MEGDEVHESTEEARAGSTPNVVRWVLAIGLFATVAIFAAIFLFGFETDAPDREAHVIDRGELEEQGDQTDSIVSNNEQFEFGEPEGDVAEDDGASVPVADSENPPTQ